MQNDASPTKGLAMDCFTELAVTPAPFFSSDPMLSTAWGQAMHPAGIYVEVTNQTHVCWQFVGLGGYKGVHVASYDHATGTWGERYTVGNFLLANDDHGDAVLLRDAEGYIHCFYGSHATPQRRSVSNNPDDISSWTVMPDAGATATYPAPVLIGSTIFLFVRNDTPGSQRKVCYSTLTPVAGGGVFGPFKNVVDLGSNSRAYRSEVHAVGTDIHFVCTRSNSADTIRQHVYYFVLDTVTGDLRNFSGSVSVPAASLPVTLTQANASFRIVDQGSNNGDLASFQFDSFGNAHLIFADGLSPTYELKHMMLADGVWTTPEAIASIADSYTNLGFVDNYTLVRGAAGAMEAWFNVDGDKVRRIRAADGTWADPEVIKADDVLRFVQGTTVLNASPDFRTLFAENSGSTSDAAAVPLALYAYGDSGPVNAAIDVSLVDPQWGDVVLLLGANHRNNATTLIDESKSSIRPTMMGNARIDTSQARFPGGASVRLDGVGDFVSVPNSTAFSFAGSGDVCLELSVRLNELGRLQCIATKRPAGNGEFALYLTAANKLQLLFWNSAGAVLQLVGTTSLEIGPWYDIEIGRVNGMSFVFMDGAIEASGVQSAPPIASSQPLLFGRDPLTSARDFNGWWTEARMTRSGRHSSSFPAITSPFPRR